MTSLDQVPMLRSPGETAGRAPRRSRGGGARPHPGLAGRVPTRRRVLQVATAVGFAAIGMFPAARKAYADGYDIWTGACPSYASDHNCSPGCGPSTVFADSCETSGAHVGFHKNDGVTWTLRPNQCYSGSYDGWLWRYDSACGTCGCGIERRCHDGYRDSGSGFVRSICRFTTDCGCPGAVTWPTVASGDTGPNAYSVQHLVTHHGFTTTADGIFGPNTQQQVTLFQAAKGLQQTGRVDSATWALLAVTTRSGEANNAVRGVQRQLVKHGHPITVDGNFGSLTEQAVRAFQSASGIGVDGIVGQVTWRTMTGTV